MSDKDIVEEARGLLAVPTTAVNFRDAAEPLLRALADEVQRLRDQFAEGSRAFKNNDAEWWRQFED